MKPDFLSAKNPSMHHPVRVRWPGQPCDRCNRRAVGRMGPEKLCGRHLEESLQLLYAEVR